MTGTEEELGKPIGSDVENEKSTYVTLCGVEGAKELVREYTQQAIDALSCFENNKELISLAEKLIGRRV